MTAPADRPYHHLDSIARELWRWSVVCSGGTAEARLAQAAHWHDALLAGRLPDAALDLGDPEAVAPLRRLLTELDLLARHQGEILSKMMIAEQVWDMNFDSDANVVEVAIKRLRAKVDAPYSIKLLHTVRGMGYVLEARPESPPLAFLERQGAACTLATQAAGRPRV